MNKANLTFAASAARTAPVERSSLRSVTVFAAFSALFFACSTASSQPVYRCGSTYGQKPCEGATVLNVDDARTPAQAATAQSDSQRVQRSGDAMEKARLHQEARAPQASVMQPTRAEQSSPTPPYEAAAAPDHGKKGKKAKHAKDSPQVSKPNYFMAVAPKKPGEPVPVKKPGKKKKSA